MDRRRLYDTCVGLVVGLVAGLGRRLASWLENVPPHLLVGARYLPAEAWISYFLPIEALSLLVRALAFGLGYGLLGLLAGVIAGGVTEELAKWFFDLVYVGPRAGRPIHSAVYSLVISLAYWLIFGWASGPRNRPSPVEIHNWSWTGAAKGFVRGLAAVVSLQVVYGLLMRFGLQWLAEALGFGVLVGVWTGLAMGFAHGGEVIRVPPVQRIGRPTRYAVIGVSASVAVTLVITRLLLYPHFKYGLDFALIGGIALGLYLGGGSYVKHLVLRLILWRSGCTPWRLVRFLDYATERIFLRKVGGGYIFIHPLLQDYFASLYEGE